MYNVHVYKKKDGSGRKTFYKRFIKSPVTRTHWRACNLLSLFQISLIKCRTLIEISNEISRTNSLSLPLKSLSH